MPKISKKKQEQRAKKEAVAAASVAELKRLEIQAGIQRRDDEKARAEKKREKERTRKLTRGVFKISEPRSDSATPQILITTQRAFDTMYDADGYEHEQLPSPINNEPSPMLHGMCTEIASLTEPALNPPTPRVICHFYRYRQPTQSPLPRPPMPCLIPPEVSDKPNTPYADPVTCSLATNTDTFDAILSIAHNMQSRDLSELQGLHPWRKIRGRKKRVRLRPSHPPFPHSLITQRLSVDTISLGCSRANIT
ncbi:hypothetical protein BDZ97DRAFT_1814790 [Flammula alnicola]|nr:hypothetical protein BDZ97DRAFT_1885039 [Flammula alnicola]KAF8964631.1 hypothetical protein BDZ97DRAFT_1814790 [Flammula alnicola]